MTQPYNLDENVTEYFEFIVKGHTYRFRHLTTEELEEARKLDVADNEKAREWIYQFISKIDEKSPDFKEITKQMTAPHWIAFQNMIRAEMGSDANIPS